MDPYAFLSPNQNLKKSASTRIDSLILKGSTSSAKINTLKIKQKAKELKEMRSIPVINDKSRKIAEGMKRDRMDLIKAMQPKEEIKEKSVEPEPVRISVNILKSLEIAEKNEEVDLKKMGIAERSKYWKEQKEKKIEEQRLAKKDKELEGCTFKPKKNRETEAFEVINRPMSAKKYEEKKVVVEKNNEKEGYLVRSQKDYELQGNNFAVMLKGKGTIDAKEKKESEFYKNLSPAVPVRLKPGFLSEISKPKGK